jgi:hypothetical protein
MHQHCDSRREVRPAGAAPLEKDPVARFRAGVADDDGSDRWAPVEFFHQSDQDGCAVRAGGGRFTARVRRRGGQEKNESRECSNDSESFVHLNTGWLGERVSCRLCTK